LCHAVSVKPHILVDGTSGEGPLAALAGALRAVNTLAVLLLAVDAPLIPLPLLEALIDAWRDPGNDSVDIVAPVVGGIVQPMPACYAKRLAPVAEQLLARGERAPRALLRSPGLRVRLLDEHALQAIDPCVQVFLGANNRAEWEALQAHAGGRRLGC
jgi:molybdopterin-guanine dinucleotide biosynthesis protein A